jgi:hypothetical protein
MEEIKMSKLINELELKLEDVIYDREHHYSSVEQAREWITRDFAEWIVKKFEEETYNAMSR